MNFETLKRPAEFKRVRGGVRWATPLFIIEGRRRPEPEAGCEPVACARFGFTITRKVGGAVVRNRIRRRLREALRTLRDAQIRPDHDYVVVASRTTHDYPFAGLQDALREAFAELHRQVERGPERGRRGRREQAGRRANAPLEPGRPPAAAEVPSRAEAIEAAAAPDQSTSGARSDRR